MIIGAHVVIHSSDPEADRAFVADVLKFPKVDVGDGWLIFVLPPSELAVHPAEMDDVHEIYLMCDDVEEFMSDMAEVKIECEEPRNTGWGTLTRLALPGGGKLGVYQPMHVKPATLSA